MALRENALVKETVVVERRARNANRSWSRTLFQEGTSASISGLRASLRPIASRLHDSLGLRCTQRAAVDGQRKGGPQ